MDIIQYYTFILFNYTNRHYNNKRFKFYNTIKELQTLSEKILSQRHEC